VSTKSGQAQVREQLLFESTALELVGGGVCSAAKAGASSLRHPALLKAAARLVANSLARGRSGREAARICSAL
jgi:hypothetical protein